MIRTASRSVAQTGKGEDRIKVSDCDSSTITAVLTDGAGGTSGGGRAAGVVVDSLFRICPADSGELFDMILELDHQLKMDTYVGLSTVVSVYADGANFIGAVIGD